MKKLNARGIAHLALPALVVVVALAAFGSYQMVKSSADTKAGMVQVNSVDGWWLTGRIWQKGTCTNTCRDKGTKLIAKTATRGAYCAGHIGTIVSADDCTTVRHRYFVAGVGCARKASQTDGVDTKYCLPGYPYYNANYTNQSDDTKTTIDYCEQSKKTAQQNQQSGTPGQANAGNTAGNTSNNSGTHTTPGTKPSQPPKPTPTPSTPKITKVLVFVEENHSLSQMSSSMPYAYSLAKQYGYASNYTAIAHPSLPNYLAIAGGSTFGVHDDNDPSSHKITAPSVFKQALDNGKTAGVFADSMNGNCALSNQNNYYVRHNPWTYFVNERAQCARYDKPLSALSSAVNSGSLPNVGMVIPNACNDAHNCPLKTADNWFKSQMQLIMSGKDWKSGQLLVVLTADEDDKQSGNKVLTVAMNPALHGKVVSSHLTHYSLSRLLSQTSGSKPLQNGNGAASLSDAFGLSL